MFSNTQSSVAPGVLRRAAIFMSGSGTNAEALLLDLASRPDARYCAAAIVTDAPETSRARELARRFQLPAVELDIRRFYAERGESAIALTTPRRRELREQWTAALRQMLLPYRIDFAVLAGFVPLTNLTADYPCLNVHPGDLTVEVDGRRIFAGLHCRPVEAELPRGERFLRSSVIRAQPYAGSGETQMDSGPVLGISAPVPVDPCGYSVEELRRID